MLQVLNPTPLNPAPATCRELRNVYHHHPESKKRKSSEGNSGSIHPYGRYGNAGKTSKTISTIAILWPVKAIFEKRAATVEVDTFISPDMPQTKTEVALQFSECCAAEVALQRWLFCSANAILIKSCAAASEKTEVQHGKTALQESGAFLPLSCGFQAPTSRHPRLGPAEVKLVLAVGSNLLSKRDVRLNTPF